MDYEKKYKEALEWMRSLYDGLHGATKEDAEHYFPELKENEDERIRKTLIEHIKGIKSWNYFLGISKEQMIAWLEKQGRKDPCIGCTNDKGCITCENGNLAEIKIEQKFKVGDWVVSNNNEEVWQIGARYTEEGQRIYLYNVNDVMMTITLDELNNDYHLWTIQDAMDGDVLLEEKTGEPFIHNGKRGTYLPEFLGAYCGIHNEEFRQYGSVYYWGKTSCPATKEQRDLLFQKIKEAGYEWDSEKKELKKIEPKTIDADKVIEWLKNTIKETKEYFGEDDMFYNTHLTLPYNSIEDLINDFREDFGL